MRFANRRQIVMHAVANGSERSYVTNSSAPTDNVGEKTVSIDRNKIA